MLVQSNGTPYAVPPAFILAPGLLQVVYLHTRRYCPRRGHTRVIDIVLVLLIKNCVSYQCFQDNQNVITQGPIDTYLGDIKLPKRV